MQNGLMTDDEIGTLIAAGDINTRPEEIQRYFASPIGKEGLANQQLGVDKWKANTPTAEGGTNDSFGIPGSPEWVAAVVMGAAAAGGGLASGGGGGAGAAGNGLEPISVGAKYLPEVAGSTVPYVGGSAAAVSSSLGSTMAAFPTAAGAAGAGGAAAVPTAVSPAAANAALNAVTNPAALTGASTVAPTFFKRVGSFLSKNKDVIGSALAGLGESMATADLQRQLLKDKAAITSANYHGTDPSKTYRGLMPDTQTETPTERFGPHNYGGYQYDYDPKVGKIVRTPIKPSAERSV